MLYAQIFVIMMTQDLWKSREIGNWGNREIGS